MLLLKLTVADIKMIVRNRQALMWALLFPFGFVILFALLGSFGDFTTTVAVVDRSDDDLSRQLVADLGATGEFVVETMPDEAAARAAVDDGDLAYLLLIPEGLEDRVRGGQSASLTLVHGGGGFGGSPLPMIEGLIDRYNLDLAGFSPQLLLTSESTSADEFDFGSFVLIGILVWGVMSNSVIGIAVALANYREKKILRRISVSPLSPAIFFAALIFAYLALCLVQTAMILGLGAMVMRVSISGNLLVIGLLIVLCNIVFLNLGFIVGAFSKTAAAASGLGNLVVLPLVMLSGIFFPTDAFPSILTDVVRFLPVAPIVEVLRGVTIHSEAVIDHPLELALIAGWLVLTSVAAIRIFKFE